MLSIVSTPIGNLKDITIRAMEVLEKCDAIVCEDTRVTGHLLFLLCLPKKELISFHSYSPDARSEQILKRLRSGQHLALVTDAGTPGISDPGSVIVGLTRKDGLPVEVIPGPSAFLAALSASGLPIDKFSYLGFLPLKKGRKALLESLKSAPWSVVFYESPHRIVRTLHELAEYLKSQPERRIVIARELTKMHEEVIMTTIGELTEIVKNLKVKGEFVVVLEGSL